MNRFCFVSMSMLFLCSCLVFRLQRVQDFYVNSEYAETIDNAELILDTLTVQKGFNSRHLEANAAYILDLMLECRTQGLPPPAKSLSLHALIKEVEFSRDYQTFNTVTVEFSVFDPPDKKAIALALYSETTKETIESYAYLHSVIQRALGYLSR